MVETEIERKWLVNINAAERVLTRKVPMVGIRQVYLVSKENIATRVRRLDKESNYKMTVKTGSGLERKEFSTKIPKVVGDELVKNLDTVIVKNRYLYKYNDLMIEVDCFYGALYGLVIAEIEFPSVEDAKAFTDIPEWFAKEITEDARYQNSNLAVTQKIPEELERPKNVPVITYEEYL